MNPKNSASTSPENGKEGDKQVSTSIPPENGKGEDVQKIVTGFQKKISEKDQRIKELEGQVKSTSENSAIETLRLQNEEMKKSLDEINRRETLAQLKTQYPDVHPDLLIDKTPEDRERLVLAQRETAKKMYGDVSFFSRRVWTSVSEIDSEIDKIQKDKSIGSLEAIKRIRELNFEKLKIT
jgi:TolA-binding protein